MSAKPRPQKTTKRAPAPPADELLAGDFERVQSSVEDDPETHPEDGAPPADWQQSVPGWIEPVHAPIQGPDVAPMFMAWIKPEAAQRWARNPRRNTEAAERLAAAIGLHRFRVPAILDEHGELRAGHTRQLAALARKMPRIPVLVQWFGNAKLGEAFSIADNRLAEIADWDIPALKDLILEEFDTGELPDVDLGALLGWSPGEMENLMAPVGGLEIGDDQQLDVIDNLPSDPITKKGDVWTLGKHRLICGDCTSDDDVRAVMGGDVAALVHADPPYGMGKEKEGVLGDNQHGKKLDEFQSRWWRAVRPFVAENASFYVWGNAENLWRWWLQSDIRTHDRLSLRNEIAWDKGDSGPGVGTAAQRRYSSSERCLFFMLGDQEYSNNANNYWEGWEPIRKYLYDERMKMGWDVKTMKDIVGHNIQSHDHWTSKSQWEMPTRQVYEAMQREAKTCAFKREYDAFKREYDDLKREYDSKRAFFDNAHDNMTDVWRFPRVIGEDRYEHATPKPVAMMERVVKSSSRPGDVVMVPFGGTGPEIIACDRTGRAARIMELHPAYCDVIIKRWETQTGQKAERSIWLSPSCAPVLVDGRRIDVQV